MHRLKYLSSESFIEGIIVEKTDGSVTIDLKGRMGQLKIPLRMLITDYPIELGQEIGMMMSYPEVLGPEINEKYATNVLKNAKRSQE